MDEVGIGKISKQWTGLLREAFTDSDNFGIQFPMDLDVRMKAVMIGACFLIVSWSVWRIWFVLCEKGQESVSKDIYVQFFFQDFMFFESNN